MKELIGVLGIVLVVGLVGPALRQVTDENLRQREWWKEPPVPYVVYSQEAEGWLYLRLTDNQLVCFTNVNSAQMKGVPYQPRTRQEQDDYVRILTRLRHKTLFQFPT